MKIHFLLLLSCSLFFCENKKPERNVDFEHLVNNNYNKVIIKDSLFYETLELISTIRNELIANEKQNGEFSKDFYCLITVVREKYGVDLNNKLNALSNRTGKEYYKTFNFYKDCNSTKNIEEAFLYLTILERDILIDYLKVDV